MQTLHTPNKVEDEIFQLGERRDGKNNINKFEHKKKKKQVKYL